MSVRNGFERGTLGVNGNKNVTGAVGTIEKLLFPYAGQQGDIWPAASSPHRARMASDARARKLAVPHAKHWWRRRAKPVVSALSVHVALFPASGLSNCDNGSGESGHVVAMPNRVEENCRFMAA
ncbi:unnamed protein product [Diplocarpon coronariae]|uniref:Uncharacterized protein n=1 Tax=Diplocarpon coronariae TaxID=2795749 RepID=A0A218Z0B7_9HELO|nr:hypothetical protein B2J93_1319 [Marssonina coronariae]